MLENRLGNNGGCSVCCVSVFAAFSAHRNADNDLCVCNVGCVVVRKSETGDCQAFEGGRPRGGCICGALSVERGTDGNRIGGLDLLRMVHGSQSERSLASARAGAVRLFGKRVRVRWNRGVFQRKRVFALG